MKTVIRGVGYDRSGSTFGERQSIGDGQQPLVHPLCLAHVWLQVAAVHAAATPRDLVSTDLLNYMSEPEGFAQRRGCLPLCTKTQPG